MTPASADRIARLLAWGTPDTDPWPQGWVELQAALVNLRRAQPPIDLTAVDAAISAWGAAGAPDDLTLIHIAVRRAEQAIRDRAADRRHATATEKGDTTADTHRERRAAFSAHVCAAYDAARARHANRPPRTAQTMALNDAVKAAKLWVRDLPEEYRNALGKTHLGMTRDAIRKTISRR